MYSHKKEPDRPGAGARTDPGRTLNRRDVAEPEGSPLYDVHREGEGLTNRTESEGGSKVPTF